MTIWAPEWGQFWVTYSIHEFMGLNLCMETLFMLPFPWPLRKFHIFICNWKDIESKNRIQENSSRTEQSHFRNVHWVVLWTELWLYFLEQSWRNVHLLWTELWVYYLGTSWNISYFNCCWSKFSITGRSSLWCSFGPTFWGRFTRYYCDLNWEFNFWELHGTYPI